MPAPLSRRSFLGLSAGFAGAAIVGLPRLGRAADKPAGMPIGIQMYSLRGFSPDEAFDHAKNLGFDYLEYYGGQFSPDSTPEQIDAMKQKVQAAGLQIRAHGVNRFTADHDKNRKLFEFAKRAGIRNLTADPTPDAFDSLDKLVSEFDIRIAIHNHGPSHRYNKGIDVVNAVKGHHPLIGACADLGHYIRSGEDPVEVIKLLGDRLYGIHLKDFAEQKEKTKGVILGKGHLDVPGVFRALKQVNFPADGCIALEYEENPKDPIAEIKECLAVAREAARSVA
jgi:sugar phosphate isomerase/epimerase